MLLLLLLLLSLSFVLVLASFVALNLLPFISQVDSSNISISTSISSNASVNIELKLQESLNGLREHYDQKAAALKAELQAMYKAQLKGLSSASASSISFETGSEGELSARDARISELMLQINGLNGRLQQSEGRFAGLEKQLAARDAKFAASLAMKDKQISELQAQVGDFMRKYNDLTNLHLALEVEVEAYGQLLANEEARLRIGGKSKTAGKRNLQPELRQLNDRFAVFIEENLKNIAAEKIELTMELQTIEVKHQQHLASVTGNYEIRLAEMQKRLDDALKAKTHMEVELKKLKDQVKDLTAKWKKAQSDASSFEAKWKAVEKDLASMTAKFNALMKEKQAALDALAKYKLELSELQVSSSAMRKELEAANMAKAILEAESGASQRDNQLNKSMFDAQVNELRMKTEFEMNEMDDSALIESDARLERSLHELRRNFEEKAAAMRLEMQGRYEGKIAALQGALSSASAKGSVLVSAVSASSGSKVASLEAEMQDLKAKLKMAEGRYATLQKAMQAKEAAFGSALSAKDSELQKIQAQVGWLLALALFLRGWADTLIYDL